MHAAGVATGLGPGRCPAGAEAANPHRAAGSCIARGAGVMILALFLALTVLLAQPVLLGPDDGPGPSPQASQGACDRPAPRTAEEFRAAFDTVSGGWLGGDQASSTLLPDGRVLWLFSDTLVGSTGGPAAADTGPQMLHSSFVLQTAGCFRLVLGPGGRDILPQPEPGGWYWPQHAIAQGGRLWVTALRVTGSGLGGPDFSLAGMDLVEFEMPRGGEPRLIAIHRTPASDAGDFGVLWGAALAVQDGDLYAYGTRRVADPLAGKELLLARVPLEHVTQLSDWQFRTALGWSTDPDRAVVLVPSHDGVSTALSVHRTGVGWVLVTKRGEFLGDAVVALIGSQPWGPFVTRVLFASTPRGSSLEYLPLAHPEAHLADGSLLVSLNHNDCSLSAVLADPTAFRPSFHEVTGLG